MDTSILHFSNLAREDGQRYIKKRYVYSDIEKFCGEKVFVALIGPRGAGKTVILRQLLALHRNTLYISLDTTRPEEGLFTAAQEAAEQGVTLLLLDEIHYYPGFASELKKIYDILNIQIICTSSSAIALHESEYDLSRRMRIIMVPPFQFREFLWFELEKEYPSISLEHLTDAELCRNLYGNLLHAEALFTKYLQGRNYPFTIETSKWMELFKAMLETIINKDLVLTGKVTVEESIQIQKLCTFIGKSFVDGISYSSCAAHCGFSKYKAEKFITILEQAFVLNRLFPKGVNVTREPKILMALPYRLLYKGYDDCIGALREDFFVETMLHLGYRCQYLKSSRGKKTPDYRIENSVFEIGGSSKGVSQFKGFTAQSRYLLVQPGRIDTLRRPLMLIGMLSKKE